MPAPNSGTIGQRVANVPVDGSSSISSRCGLGEEHEVDGEPTVGEPRRARRQRRVDDRPLRGQRHLDRAVALVDDHPPAGGLDARHRPVRRRARRAGPNVIAGTSGAAPPRRSADGRQRQARQPRGQRCVVGVTATAVGRPSPAAGAPTSGRGRPACPRCTRTSPPRRRARAARPCTGRTRRRRGSRAATSTAGSRSPAASRAPPAAGWRSARDDASATQPSGRSRRPSHTPSSR